jgi:hypothetical protein
MSHSELLDRYLNDIVHSVQSADDLPILDLACGQGRNGLFLSSRNLPVVYADRNADALAKVESSLDEIGLVSRDQSELFQVDLEVPSAKRSHSLFNQNYSSVLVFRYLHRPLMPWVLNSISDQGLLIYETFTVNNRQYGRPNNPDFLLEANELIQWLEQDSNATWQVLHHFEGYQANPDRDIAQLVARKSLL